MLFEPSENASSSNHAYVNGMAATRALTKAEQKLLGQYMTPPAIARFMAQRAVQDLHAPTLRVLEPAAGSGVLAAAAIEAVLKKSEPPQRIELLLYEIDERLIPTLEQLCTSLQAKCAAHGVVLDHQVRREDFLLSATALEQRPLADLIISNPPYFKLPKQDPRVAAHAYAVWGQPNIYGLFMAACANLLREGGRYCFITPRSWMSGPYFSAMRRHLLAQIRLDALHVFDSRIAHFSEDQVLQEAVISWGTARAPESTITVSSSHGAHDLDSAVIQQLPLSHLVRDQREQVIRFPSSTAPAATPEPGYTLADLGLKVSTGPVIAFRATDFLLHEKIGGSVALLWLQHIKYMTVQWPIHKKREHILACAQNAWMLLKNEPMVILRRFSPKEDARRVTAAPYFGDFPGAVIGIENHLNYIHRPGGTLSNKEVIGLAAYLNSPVVSAYFESVSGHTQVNATDLRQLPMPSTAKLEEIGTKIKPDDALETVDKIVAQVLGLPPTPSCAPSVINA